MNRFLKILLAAFLGLCALIVILLGLFFVSLQRPPKPPRGKVISQEEGYTTWSDKSITVEWNGYRFKHPMKFGGILPQSGITLHGYGPKFEGTPPPGTYHTPEEFKNLMYDEILVFIDDYCVFKPTPSKEKIMENTARNEAHFKRDYFDPEFDEALGLLVYRKRYNNEPTVYSMTNPDVRSPGGGIISASCPPPPAIEGDEGTVLCQSAFAFRPDLCITIRFYKKHLRDWRTIHASVLNFVETSMKAAKEE